METIIKEIAILKMLDKQKVFKYQLPNISTIPL